MVADDILQDLAAHTREIYWRVIVCLAVVSLLKGRAMCAFLQSLSGWPVSIDRWEIVTLSGECLEHLEISFHERQGSGRGLVW